MRFHDNFILEVYSLEMDNNVWYCVIVNEKSSYTFVSVEYLLK